MRDGTPRIRSTQRSLATLEAVIADAGRSSVSELARQTGIPGATAHRQIATLVTERYLVSSGGGRHVAGPRLFALLHRLDEKQAVANVAAPVLHRLAARVRSIAQLGTFENEMVTYRIKTGRMLIGGGASDLFTRIGMQLEAYCSGIGKVLLAHLPAAERAAYLAGGPFVPLTRRTIVDPGELGGELDRVRAQGFARDTGEIVEGLFCLAVPIRKPDGCVDAAISVSQSEAAKRRLGETELLALLCDAAREIAAGAYE